MIRHEKPATFARELRQALKLPVRLRKAQDQRPKWKPRKAG